MPTTNMILRRVTLRQLRVFESVARHLSFSRAAEELHLTQPAVSMQVSQLEQYVGLPLTEQIGKKIHLTEAGRELARHARLVAQQLQAAEASLDALQGLRGGRLNIGVVSTAKYFALRLLSVFRSRYPGVELRLEVHNREEIVRELHDNEIDLAIMGRPPEDFPTVAEPFAEHPLIIVAPPAHALAGKRRVALDQLAQETFLIRERGSGTRGAMERFFAEQGFAPTATFEMSSNETIKQAVMAGMGVAFLSAHTMGQELAMRWIVRLDIAGTPIVRRWFVVYRGEKRLLPLAQEFGAFLQAEGAQVIAAQGQPAEGTGVQTRRPPRQPTRSALRAKS